MNNIVSTMSPMLLNGTRKVCCYHGYEITKLQLLQLILGKC